MPGGKYNSGKDWSFLLHVILFKLANCRCSCSPDVSQGYCRFGWLVVACSWCNGTHTPRRFAAWLGASAFSLLDALWAGMLPLSRRNAPRRRHEYVSSINHSMNYVLKWTHDHISQSFQILLSRCGHQVSSAFPVRLPGSCVYTGARRGGRNNSRS